MTETKAEVNYSPGMLHSHCGPTFHDDKYYCRHFMPDGGRTTTGRCEVVQGEIERAFWCERYHRIPKKLTAP